MSIESKEIQDLHEIYSKLYEQGPTDGVKKKAEEQKPIVIKIKGGGTKTIYPNNPDYNSYKNNERKFSGEGEGRIKINPDGRSGSSAVDAKADQSGTLTDKDKEEIIVHRLE